MIVNNIQSITSSVKHDTIISMIFVKNNFLNIAEYNIKIVFLFLNVNISNNILSQKIYGRSFFGECLKAFEKQLKN